MKNTNIAGQAWRRIGIGMAVALLAGCGGVGEEEEASPADTALYTETMAYCDAEEPVGGPAEEGGWSLTSPSKYGNPSYEASALVSPRGAELQFPLHMKVGVNDYRGVSGPVIDVGYREPEWGMGVILHGRLPARAAACVRSLAKRVPVQPAPGLPSQGPVYGSTLSWNSKWAVAVPVASVAGAVLDGFEFVSSFAPAEAQTFFILSKRRLPSAAGMTICHLAPSAASWDCAAAAVTDLGKDWGLVRRGAQAGAYVLAAPRG